MERDLLIDVTFFADLRCQTYLRSSSGSSSVTTKGHALHLLKQGKERSYGDLCRRIGSIFHAAAFELFGSTAEDTELLITKLVRLIAEKRNTDFNCLLSSWKKRISAVIQKGNAQFRFRANDKLLNRVRDMRTPPPEQIHSEALRRHVHHHFRVPTLRGKASTTY